MSEHAVRRRSVGSSAEPPRTSRRRHGVWGVVVVFVASASAACGSGDETTGSTATSSSSAAVTEPSTGGTIDTTVSTPSTSADCATVLENGCAGDDVRRLQRLLNSKGFGPLTVDQQFGSKTAAALDVFESECGACTGDRRIVIDGNEWAFLESLPTTAPEEPSG